MLSGFLFLCQSLCRRLQRWFLYSLHDVFRDTRLFLAPSFMHTRLHLTDHRFKPPASAQSVIHTSSISTFLTTFLFALVRQSRSFLSTAASWISVIKSSCLRSHWHFVKEGISPHSFEYYSVGTLPEVWNLLLITFSIYGQLTWDKLSTCRCTSFTLYSCSYEQLYLCLRRLSPACEPKEASYVFPTADILEINIFKKQI